MIPVLAGLFQAFPDALESVWEFFYAGKLFMLFLLGLSVLALSVILFKALDLRRDLILPQEAVDAVDAAPHQLTPTEARALAARLRSSKSTLGRLGALALTDGHADRDEAARAVEARAREEVVELESGVALLEVVITIAPLLGLLGTVSGLVGVFSNLGDTADHAAIASGIAEALNTTIAGLAIAVPTVIAHSYFMKKIERIGVRLEILLGSLVTAAHRGRTGSGSDTTAATSVVAQQETGAEDELHGADVPAGFEEVGAEALPDPRLHQQQASEPPPQPAPTPQPVPRLLSGHPPGQLDPGPEGGQAATPLPPAPRPAPAPEAGPAGYPDTGDGDPAATDEPGQTWQPRPQPRLDR